MESPTSAAVPMLLFLKGIRLFTAKRMGSGLTHLLCVVGHHTYISFLSDIMILPQPKNNDFPKYHDYCHLENIATRVNAMLKQTLIVELFL